MPGIDKPPRHRVYVLRYWEVRSQRSEGEPAWRFCLEDPASGQRLGFASLGELMVFLDQETGGSARLAPARLRERPGRGRWRRRRQPRLSRI